MQSRQNTARLSIKTILTAVISDLRDNLSHRSGKIDVSAAPHLTGHYDLAGGDEGFACYFTLGIVRQKLVKHCVGNLIGNFIGMSLRHRFRCEQVIHFSIFFAGGCKRANPSTDGYLNNELTITQRRNAEDCL